MFVLLIAACPFLHVIEEVDLGEILFAFVLEGVFEGFQIFESGFHFYYFGFGFVELVADCIGFL